MADATLEAIRKKVRRLTRSPSVEIITTDEIDEYINTFILYDFPEHLRLFSLKTTLTFYTEPNQDVYETNATVGDPLEDFKDKYITIHPPIYVAGFEAVFSQSRDEFYALYPQVSSIMQEAVGDGVTTNFAGTLTNIPVLKNNVFFSSIDVNDAGLELHDDGATGLDGNGTGTINYLTGAYTLSFIVAPKLAQPINSMTLPYVASRPNTVLYYDNKFTVRPVPDQPYPIQVEAYQRPTELSAFGDIPELQQWWQYIAYGAAKKLFEDRTDSEGLERIMSEFKAQELLVLRRTIVQQTNERVATIYSDALEGRRRGSGWNSY